MGLGFTRFNGHCSPLQAELWGIFAGLKIAWNRNYTRVIEAIKLIDSSTDDSYTHPLIRMIGLLHQQQWATQVKLISREANSVAHALINADPSATIGTILYADPPSTLMPHLDRSLHGPPHLRA
ncbi:hypothetical protein F3Y22_tig00001644pilonHSYRG00335 [Hibiscus syriacus]|uniref:RNase H type-1 domain-containing protein n=1 Tax=Hibiscus syriacus TaxID=106335 RepID=A0A6A3CUP4_HIBSY|nr:hypothetical protein F3Y22_tig00001644pilonHSYRG00335 [Hibiscus syriacus]